jgi:hypothetical protein
MIDFFDITSDRIGAFQIDNATNNDIALIALIRRILALITNTKVI